MRDHSCGLFVTGACFGLEAFVWATDATKQTSASARRVGSGGHDNGGAATLAAVGSRAYSEPGPRSDLVRRGYYDPMTGEEAKAVKLGALPEVIP